MKGRDPVDRVASDNREVGHAYFLVGSFLDNGEFLQKRGVSRKFSTDLVEEPAINFEDNFEMAGKDFRQQRYGPAFERFRRTV